MMVMTSSLIVDGYSSLEGIIGHPLIWALAALLNNWNQLFGWLLSITRGVIQDHQGQRVRFLNWFEEVN